ncbi:MAG TPA: hypothetical protein VII00_06080 [bacterium]
MLVGYNQNINYKGMVFHVQTEDNGVKNPFIITHVFVGGNIVASRKTGYDDIVKVESLEKILRDLMEEQHKAIIQKIMNGEYNDHPLVREHLRSSGKGDENGAFEELELKDNGTSLDEVILDYLDEEDIERKG